jgi:hypothetical protein
MAFGDKSNSYDGFTQGIRLGYLSGSMDFKGKLTKGKVSGGGEEHNIELFFPGGDRTNYKKGKKTLVLTVDPGGDASKRFGIPIGDQENEAKPEEGQRIISEPGNPENAVTFKKGGVDLVSKDGAVIVDGKTFDAFKGLISIDENGNISLANGAIKIDKSSGKITINAADIDITGQTKINGILQTGD